MAWLADRSGVLASAVEQGSIQAQVWQVSESDGKATKLTNDFNDYRDLSATSDSSQLVTVQNESRVNIWIANSSDYSNAKQMTTGIGEYDGVRGLAWMTDNRLVYVSRASGSQDIWTMAADGGEKKQLTTAATRADVHPTVSKDGRFIVFTSNRQGNSNLWRMNVDGTDPKQLTNGSGEEFPHLSPDGQTIVYTSTASSKFTLWRTSIEGDTPVQLTDRLSQRPAVSPDGRLIACWYRTDANSPWRIAVLPIAGGDALKVFEVPSTQGSSIPLRWTPDNQMIAFVDTRSGVSNIYGQPLEGGSPKQLTDFKSAQIFWFDWSQDGKRLACARGSVTSDLILISGYK
ncbi:MAG: DPP IV N-terminal domain-containing protein [Pyrinomonadaceae bacterium]